MPGNPEVSAVILTAERAMEATIREILRRSFQLVFPVDGGEAEHTVGEQQGAVRRRTRP